MRQLQNVFGDKKITFISVKGKDPLYNENSTNYRVTMIVTCHSTKLKTVKNNGIYRAQRPEPRIS